MRGDLRRGGVADAVRPQVEVLQRRVGTEQVRPLQAARGAGEGVGEHDLADAAGGGREGRCERGVAGFAEEVVAEVDLGEEGAGAQGAGEGGHVHRLQPVLVKKEFG